MTIAIAPAFLQLATPSDPEAALIKRMIDKLAAYYQPNADAEAYYEGSFVTQQFGISVPPSMQSLQTVAGWGGTAVDVLEERVDWLGWTSETDDFDLPRVYADNMLDVDSGMAHLDSFIFGKSFVVVGSGFSDEPSPLITTESPKTMTDLFDRRRRRSVAALSLTPNEESGYLATEATLYTLDETITVARDNSVSSWVVTNRDRHNLHRLPVVAMPNRVRGSRTEGRSEITKAVRYYTDAAVRTLLGLEVNREFYNSPQRVALNVDESLFRDAAGNAVSQWTAIQGRVWAIPPNDEGEAQPSVQQFSPSSPAPYIDQIKGYAQLLAAEAGIPGAYLGFHTDNPASADAIRAGEARLVKRAERRQTTFGRAWLEVARLALLVRDGEVPDGFDSVSVRWRDAATPTRAAAADEALKLTSGDNPILPPDSTVTYDRIGLSPAEQRQITADKRRSAGRNILAQIAAAAPVTSADVTSVP